MFYHLIWQTVNVGLRGYEYVTQKIGEFFYPSKTTSLGGRLGCKAAPVFYKLT